MKELSYPFDGKYLRRNRRKLRNALLSGNNQRIRKKIAVLGGSTADDVVFMLELFLLDAGIEPEFYVSEYNKFYEDAMFGNPELDSFKPDIIYIHTTCRNLTMLPESLSESPETVQNKLAEQFEVFKQMWIKLMQKFSCPIIQNNFELPLCRPSGSYDGWGDAGKSAFINRLNVMMSDYARHNNGFFINDINYLSAAVGLEKWHNSEEWYLYKYAVSLEACPDLAFSVANIVKSVFGKNKKVIALDLDNTLWGGVIGDDGQEGIELGEETAVGESFRDFQRYLREYRSFGVLLTVCSKNDEENAVLGLNHPESQLKPDDFTLIKANWNSKDRNIEESADELNLLPESFVFVDDNPAECAIVSAQLPQVQTVNFQNVSEAMYKLSRNGFFEVTSLSADDLKRTEMYAANARREAQRKSFESYSDYLLSLEMEAVIEDFRPVCLQRITQLTNKSNQFNLTTKRYTQQEMEEVSASSGHIRLYGRLADKFGDNGIVSVVIGCKKGVELHIELWLMSCRVLKRDMELAMLDELVRCCREAGIDRIIGYYYKTPKNSMVAELFGTLGFALTEKKENGDSVWCLETAGYVNQNKVIEVNKEREKYYGNEQK